MRVERRGAVSASAEEVWEAVADWRTHTEWQPSLAEVELPDGPLAEGARLVEVRASHGQRLTFDVVIAEWEPARRVRASGRSRGVVSVTADLVYELTAAEGGAEVLIAVEAELPFVLLPLRHAAVVETEKELDAMLARLAAMEHRGRRVS